MRKRTSLKDLTKRFKGMIVKRRGRLFFIPKNKKEKYLTTRA